MAKLSSPANRLAKEFALQDSYKVLGFVFVYVSRVRAWRNVNNPKNLHRHCCISVESLILCLVFASTSLKLCLVFASTTFKSKQSKELKFILCYVVAGTVELPGLLSPKAPSIILHQASVEGLPPLLQFRVFSLRSGSEVSQSQLKQSTTRHYPDQKV